MLVGVARDTTCLRRGWRDTSHVSLPARMSARRDAITQWTSALEGQLPAWHAALQTAKKSSTSTSWDPAAVSACMQATLPSLLPLYEQASDICKAARTEADKPCVWDDVLFTSTWELIHAYILSAGHVNDVMDRVDMALVLADAGTSRPS